MTGSPAQRPGAPDGTTPAEHARTHPRVPHRRSTAVWTLVVPGALTTGIVTRVLGWRGELPDPVASHWGSDGVDGFSSLGGLVGPLVAAIAAFSVAMWAVGHWRGQQAMTRRWVNAMAVWFAAFLGGILLGTVWIQRGLQDAADVGGVGSVLVLTLLGSTVAAALVGWATPGDAPAPTSAPIPADAPQLPVADGEQVTWVREVGQRATALLLAVSLGSLILVGALSDEWLITGAMALLLFPLVIAFVRWTVIVDRHGLTARSMLRFPRLRIPLDEVERAEVVTVNALGDFGGWGLRTGLDGRVGVVLRSGPAIQVHRTAGRVTVVTVDDAETAVALLNGLAARAREEGGRAT